MKQLMFFLCWLLWSAPAAADREYHPGDAAVIDNLLKINDAENRGLAGAGWEIGRPETWTFSPASRTPNDAPAWSADGRLKTLALPGYGLTGVLDLTGLEALTRLDLSNNRLTGVRGLAGLKELDDLSLNGNQLADVGDLGGLVKLRSLALTANQLTDVGDLGRLVNLERLALGLNRLTRLPDFANMKKLRLLNIAANPFENYRALDGLDWSRVRFFDYSIDQLPGFSLAGKRPHLVALGIRADTLRARAQPNPEPIDLAGRRIDLLTLYGHLTADKLKNPGPIKVVVIFGDNNYSMAEFQALAQHFSPARVDVFTVQTANLGDAAFGLKAGTAYRPDELSPRLAEELSAAGPGARLLAATDPINFGQMVFDHGRKTEPEFLRFQNGRVTFREPGDFYLAVTTDPEMEPDQPRIAVSYRDLFTLK